MLDVSVSIEHRLDLVVEGLVVQVVDFYCLEIFLRIEVSLSNQEGLSEHNLFYFGIVVVHDIIIHIPLLFAYLQEICNLLC